MIQESSSSREINATHACYSVVDAEAMRCYHSTESRECLLLEHRKTNLEWDKRRVPNPRMTPVAGVCWGSLQLRKNTKYTDRDLINPSSDPSSDLQCTTSCPIFLSGWLCGGWFPIMNNWMKVSNGKNGLIPRSLLSLQNIEGSEWDLQRPRV